MNSRLGGHEGRKEIIMLEKICTRVWAVWGANEPVLRIAADSFDDAIAQARKVSQNYNTARPLYILKYR